MARYSCCTPKTHKLSFDNVSFFSLIQSTKEQSLTQEGAGYYYSSGTNFNTKMSASYIKRRKLYRPSTVFSDQARPFVGILYTDLNREVEKHMYMVNSFCDKFLLIYFIILASRQAYLLVSTILLIIFLLTKKLYQYIFP